MANKCKKVYESNIPWLMAACSGHESHTPEWQWQRARQAGMHGRRGKFPLRDGQWTGLGQALQQNVHFISGKVPGRTGRAKFFEAREKLIKVQAKEPYKYTWTNRRSDAARQRRSHQKTDQRDINACYIIPVVRFVSVCGIICQESTERWGFSATERCSANSKF